MLEDNEVIDVEMVLPDFDQRAEDLKHWSKVGGGDYEAGKIYPDFQQGDGKFIQEEYGDNLFKYVDSSTGEQRELFYKLVGSGKKKVMMVMGLGGYHLAWEHQMPLAEMEDIQICVMDNRGVGFSDLPEGRWRTSDLSRDVIHLLDYLAEKYDEEAWKQSVHLVGVSMGGMVSMETALMDPSRFTSLSLMVTGAGGLSMIPSATGLATIIKNIFNKTEHSTLSGRMNLLFPPEYLRAKRPDGQQTNHCFHGANIVRRHRTYLDRGHQPKPGLPKQVLACLTHYVSNSRLHVIRDSPIEVMVIAAGQDCLIHPRNSRQIAKALGAKYVEFPEAGHAFNEQYPSSVNQHLFQHFNSSHKIVDPLMKRKTPPSRPHVHPFLLYLLVLFTILTLRFMNVFAGNYDALIVGAAWLLVVYRFYG